jgi:hypothetical protein
MVNLSMCIYYNLSIPWQCVFTLSPSLSLYTTISNCTGNACLLSLSLSLCILQPQNTLAIYVYSLFVYTIIFRYPASVCFLSLSLSRCILNSNAMAVYVYSLSLCVYYKPYGRLFKNLDLAQRTQPTISMDWCYKTFFLRNAHKFSRRNIMNLRQNLRKLRPKKFCKINP